MPNRSVIASASVLDHIHCRAICDEIGERLRYILGREALEIPPRLLMPVDKLAHCAFNRAIHRRDDVFAVPGPIVLLSGQPIWLGMPPITD